MSSEFEESTIERDHVVALNTDTQMLKIEY